MMALHIGICCLGLWFFLGGCGASSEGEESSEQSNAAENGEHTSTASTTGSSSRSGGGGAVKAAKERNIDVSGETLLPRPDPVCGEDGFAYLLQQYFYPHCSRCHGLGSASKNLEVSYPAMKIVPDDMLQAVILSGKFCVDDCRLTGEDPLFSDIVQWQGQKDSCSQ